MAGLPPPSTNGPIYTGIDGFLKSQGNAGKPPAYPQALAARNAARKWNDAIAKAAPPPAGGVDPKVAAAAAAALATAKAVTAPKTKADADAAAKAANDAADTVKGDPLEGQLKAEATRITGLIASISLKGGRRRKATRKAKKSKKSRKATKKSRKAKKATKKSKKSRKSKGRK